MSTLGPSKRCTKRHVRNLDLNSLPAESDLLEGASGSRHPRISRGTSFSGVLQHSHAIGSQQGSPALPTDHLSSSLIDVDLIEDEVVMLSSSRGFSQGRNRSRRNQPVMVVLDEDLETNFRESVIVVEEQVARSSLNTRNKRARSSTSRTIINCDLYPDLDEEYNAKRKNAMKSKHEAEKVTMREPTFTCPICLSALVEASSTICGHIFCLQCIKTSIQVQKKCPSCRRKLTMSNFHRVYLPAAN